MLCRKALTRISLSQSIAKSLLANSVIQHWTIGEIMPSFPEEAESTGTIEIIPFRDLSDDQLLALSKDRRAALDLAEMQAMQELFCQRRT